MLSSLTAGQLLDLLDCRASISVSDLFAAKGDLPPVLVINELFDPHLRTLFQLVLPNHLVLNDQMPAGAVRITDGRAGLCNFARLLAGWLASHMIH
jgi:hypothetical protein